MKRKDSRPKSGTQGIFSVFFLTPLPLLVSKMALPAPGQGFRSKEVGGADEDPNGMILLLLFQATSENGFSKVFCEKSTFPDHQMSKFLSLFCCDS